MVVPQRVEQLNRTSYSNDCSIDKPRRCVEIVIKLLDKASGFQRLPFAVQYGL
jgi:hypothetical protein